MDIIVDDSYSFAYLSRIGAAITMPNELGKLPRPLSTVDKEAEKEPVLFWGEDNDFPQQVIASVRKNPVVGTLLGKQAGLLYSSGLTWGIPTYNANGEEILKPLSEKENTLIRQWARRTNLNRYIMEAAKDLFWFGNVFPEIVLNLGRTEIMQLCVQAAEECRYGTQNPKSGFADSVYLNAQWPDGKPDDGYTKKIAVLDSYYDAAGQLAAGSATNYIYPFSLANPGSKFYQVADWNSFRESGWMDVMELIPKFKKALLGNQMTIKYHIQISNMYWEVRFPGYKTKSPKDQLAIKVKELQSIEDTLAGAEKAGKSLTSTIHHDFNIGKEFELIKITAVDDKIKDGKYLEEGKDASLYAISSVGLHPALIGTVPNNGLGGAGSNIREAYNLNAMTNRFHQDLILEPLNNLIIPFNKWPEEMEFRFRNNFMTTLDKGRETKPAA